MAPQEIFMSRSAALQERNVFVWYPEHHGTIFFSWRVDKEAPITVQKMYRWMQIVLRYHKGVEGPLPTPQVFAARIEPSIMFKYKVTKDGAVLRHDSNDFLQPGHYCIYYGAHEDLLTFPEYVHEPMGSYWMKASKPQFESMMKISASLQEQTLIRDGKSCCFTSARDELEILWIIPPHACYQLEPDLYERSDIFHAIKKNPSICERHKTIKNCLTMHKDMAKLFRDNLISVDVDDDYRIIRFDKREDTIIRSGTRLVLNNNHDGPSDEYLKCHFTWSLHIHSGDGDFEYDYSHSEIDVFLRNYGYAINDPQYEQARETDLGKQAVKWIAQNPPL